MEDTTHYDIQAPDYQEVSELNLGVKVKKVSNKRKILVVGATGSGKSNLCNLLCQKDYFASSGEIRSITQNVQKIEVTYDDSVVVLYDTPGVFDTCGKDFKVQAELNALLKFGIPYLSHVFVLVSNDRAASIALKTIRNYFSMMEKELIKSVCTLIITKTSYCDRTKITKSYFTNQDFNDIMSFSGITRENIMFVDLNINHISNPKFRTFFELELKSIWDRIKNSSNLISTFQLFPAIRETELSQNVKLQDELTKMSILFQRTFANLKTEEKKEIISLAQSSRERVYNCVIS